MASMSTKTVEEVVKDLTKLLEKCEGDGFEPGWWHAWNYLGDDCRCAGEGFEEVKKLLGTEQQALLGKNGVGVALLSPTLSTGSPRLPSIGLLPWRVP